MPTPSPNQPPDPSPPTSQPFLSCPDDLLHSSLLHSSQVFRQALDTSQNPGGTTIESESLSLNLQSSDVSNRQTHTLSAEDSDLIEEHTSPESLLRSATLSPRLQSNLPSSSPSNHSIREGESSEQYQNCTGHISAGVSSVYRRLTSIISEPECLAEGEHISMMAYDGDSSSLFQSPDFSALRTIPISPSSYLRPGSRFHGTQQSERQVYDVQVEIKHVDMGESFLCGYLRIQGLTEDHPTLTTYFEGEIIGSKYSFFTQHEDWGANAKVDLSHWAKFSAFRPFQKHARKGPVRIKDVSQKENIFMRWKEHFLVPDHRVRTITGASFEGFYYICFNQVKGEVSGIYFHSKSEKFQQLELKHVPDRGRFSAMEFR